MKEDQTIVAHVATLPELVENILMHLPVQDVLQAQRVNRTWRYIIIQSPKLQRALFFKPVATGAVSYGEHTTIAIRNCVSSADCDPDAFGGDDYITSISSVQSSTKETSSKNSWNCCDLTQQSKLRLRLNPFLDRALPWLRVHQSSASLNSGGWQSGVIVRSIRGHRKAVPTAVSRQEASWRKMIFSQPPSIELIADVGGCHWHHCRSENGEGVTLGKLADRVDSFGGELNSIHGCRSFCLLTTNDDGRATELTAAELLDAVAE